MSIATAHYITPNSISYKLIITTYHVYEDGRVTLRSVLYYLNIY